MWMYVNSNSWHEKLVVHCAQKSRAEDLTAAWSHPPPISYYMPFSLLWVSVISGSAISRKPLSFLHQCQTNCFSIFKEFIIKKETRLRVKTINDSHCFSVLASVSWRCLFSCLDLSRSAVTLSKSSERTDNFSSNVCIVLCSALDSNCCCRSSI